MENLVSDTVRVHLVIPCFRESKRLRPFLEELCSELKHLPSVSILVVDDGSGDAEQTATRVLVDEFRARHPFVNEMLALQQNVGKGGAVYAGWAAHEGEEWLMFVDADGSISAAEVARMIRLSRAEGIATRGYFASRITMLGRTVQRVVHRDIMGQVFHWIVNALLALGAHDTQCGCKLIPRAEFERARPALSLTGYAFDLELLLALKGAGCDVVEVPVDWHETPGGKIRLIRDSLRMLKDVFRLRRLQAEGLYRIG